MSELGRDKVTGKFLPGNRLWEARSSAGPKPMFETAEELRECVLEYFSWAFENPLHDVRPMKGEGGNIEMISVPKMRAMTVTGLCLFLNISRQTWENWKSRRADLVDICTWAENCIRTQKLEGAAANLLNPSIIAREISLGETTEAGLAIVVRHTFPEPEEQNEGDSSQTEQDGS